MKRHHIIFSFFLFLFIPFSVNATSSADFVFEGNELMLTGEEQKINIAVRNITGSELTVAGGRVMVEDESCLQIVSMEKIDSAAAANIANQKFSYMNISGLTKDTELIQVGVKASEKTCSTQIKIMEPRLAFYNKDQIIPDCLAMDVTVINYDEIMLNANSLKLSERETYQLQLYVPSSIVINPGLITWSSLNSTIASVDNTGKIRANMVGVTTINALLLGKNYQTKVTVVDYLKGDVNGDGKINPLDHYLALRMSLGLTKPSSAELVRGDVNENNRIDAGDVYYILRRSLGLKN